MKKITFRNDVLPLKNEIFRLALRITLNREEAEDIVQDTLIKVWNNRDNWDNIESIEAYSLRIARNLSLDSLRHHGNHADTLSDEQAESPDTASNPFQAAAQKDSVAQVRRIIDHLPEKQRSCIQLRDFEGKSYKEIAQLMDITEEQVKVNIFRARQRIKQEFQAFNRYGL